MGVSTAVSVAIKAVVARPRPPITTMFVPSAETSASFPSGHTIGAATFLFVGAYLVVSRRPGAWRLFCWCVAALIGVVAVALSRLYLGYHFLTDVLAAVALALAILGTVMIVDRLRALRGSRESRHV
jgi:undecaprenyl-diphosphatase